MTLQETNIDRSCGISGCEADWLSSRRHEVDGDIQAFTAWALRQGWGDGLPLVPPTEERVQDFLVRGGRFPDELIAHLPPLKTECTVEKIAINAVMAGAPPESMPLLIAAIEAMADPKFDLAGLNATTGSVVPAVIVNGPRVFQPKWSIMPQRAGVKPLTPRPPGIRRCLGARRAHVASCRPGIS